MSRNRPLLRPLPLPLAGINLTCDCAHMWLAPFTPGTLHTVTVTLDVLATLGALRIWNYSKSRVGALRGARCAAVLATHVRDWCLGVTCWQAGLQAQLHGCSSVLCDGSWSTGMLCLAFVGVQARGGDTRWGGCLPGRSAAGARQRGRCGPTH